MTTLRTPWLHLLAGLIVAISLPLGAFAQAPAIAVQPQNLSVVSGSNATLSVTASGDDLFYQWQFSGVNLFGRTNSTLSLTNINLNNGGVYSVIVTNSSGSVTSELALVNVDEHLTFRIFALQTNGAIAIECNSFTGNDRGGLVVAPNDAFLTGANGTTRFQADDFSSPSSMGVRYDSLCSDLRTAQIYVMANGTNIITTGGTVNSLLELDPETGLWNGNRITLSTNISFTSGGIFSGYGRIVLWTTANTYDIAMPSGKVTLRGITSGVSRSTAQGWSVCWGLAEYFTNTLHFAYVQNTNFPYTTIARHRVGPGGTPSVLQRFNHLGDMANMAFSVARSRWYFHMENTNQFRTGSGIDETIGSAKAIFSTNAGVPYIYRHPTPQTNYPGSNVTLSVVAVGNGPFAYEWRLNGTNIDAPNSATLVLSNLTPAMLGNYSVVVANDAGSAVSADAFVFVVTTPRILAEPQTISALAGTNALFTVTAQAAPPVSYQWLFNGTNILNATNASYFIPAVTAADVGDYRVIITNSYGSATSAVARLVLIVEAAFSFKILSLGNDAVLQEHLDITGDDRGGIAVSSNRVFVGGDVAPGMFSAADLSGGVPLSTLYDSLVTDLRTEKVYSLGDKTNLFRTITVQTSLVVSTLIEIDGNTGARTTNIITLSAPIALGSGAGLFSGYGQVVLHNGSRVFSIALPSGVVADLGAMSSLSHQFTENWAYWGIAENFGGSVSLAYVQDYQSIVRARVPDGLVTSVANFINLSDMASMSASVSRGRWYFHFEGQSQFGGSNQTVGYCSAAFSVTPNAVIDHYTFEPLPGAQFSGVPFPAMITARTLGDTVVSNFSGTVSFTAFTTADGTPVTVLPSSSANFINGTWTGELVVPNASAGIYLRATDLAGRFGVSTPFSVVTTNDLALLVNPSTNSATIYAPLTYRLLLTNSGPETSTAVFATNVLPANVNFISATPSQGSCALNAGTVVCDIGSMSSGQSVMIDIAMMPFAVGNMTNIASVVRAAAEDHLENNAVTNIVPVALTAVVFSDPSALEGDTVATRGTNVFTVSLNATSPVPVSVQYTTAPGTATNTGDYVSKSGLIVFAPGVTTTNISILLGGERNYELDEYFYMNFFNVTNAILVRTQAFGTIINDDPQPVLIVTNTFITEGNSGSTLLQFPVQLSSVASVPVSVNYYTSNGTAVAGTDYTTKSNLLYFPAGTTNLFISVNITPDTAGESNEFFYVRFFNGTNITVNTQIVIVIMNDDPANVLHHFTWSSIAPTQQINVPFTASLTAKDVVNRTLSNYAAAVRLSSGAASGQREAIMGDVVPPASFTGGPWTIGFAFTPSVDIFITHVRHISGVKVSVWRETGIDTGTLVFSQPTISVNGTWLETALPTPVKLTAGVTYRVGGYNGSAANPWYYGTTLPPTFKYGTIGHGFYQSGDQFPTFDLSTSFYFVDLSYALSLFSFSMTPTNIAFTNGGWNGPIRVLAPGTNFKLFATDTNTQVSSASDPFDVLLIDDIGLQITPSANPTPTNENLVYSITVSNAGPTISTGVIMTNRLPANASYISSASDHGSLTTTSNQVVADIGTLGAGEVATVAIAVFPDGAGSLTNWAVVKRNESEVFLLNNAQTNVVTATDLGISVNDVALVEGHAGVTNAVFKVTLSAASTQTISVAYTLQPGSATGGTDYQDTNGVLVFPPGVKELTVPVPVYGDLFSEYDEYFYLYLVEATNAPITRSFGNATIFNDDPLPMISVSDITLQEGRNGYFPATFNLTLSQPSGRFVYVYAYTIDGSTDFDDYIANSLYAEFAPGQTNATMVLSIHGDNVVEPDEFFLLRLYSPGNATLAAAEARCTILNDDTGAGAGLLDHFEWSIVLSPQTVERGFNVAIVARDGVDALFPFNGTVFLSALADTNLIGISPTNTTTFTNGVWAGTIVLSNAATNVVLVADDGAGHTGASNPFDVNATDIALLVSAPPQALIETPFEYIITVTNLGPAVATVITITNRVPSEAAFTYAYSFAGSCYFFDGVVSCDAGALGPGQSTVVYIGINPLRGGPLTNAFFGVAFEFDPVLTNNNVALVVEITGDEDHDGLPDDWEWNNGLSPLDSSDAGLDPDGDGRTNLEEYIAGTDRLNPASVLKVSAAIDTGYARIQFATVLNKRYVIEHAFSMDGPWTDLSYEFYGDGSTFIFYDPELAGDAQHFYRVRVVR
jgi:uncharacterized repeat protein (TIGR01451 family)